VSRAAASAPAAVYELTSLDQVAALVHPLRRRILAALAEPASPADVARYLGLPPQLANYHVRALAAAGLAEEVEVRQRRNLLAHRFRAVARTFSLGAALPLSDEQRQRLQQDVALQALLETADGLRRAALGLLDQPERPDRHLATLALDVELGDEADRAAFVRAVVEAVQQAAAPYRARTGRDAAAAEGSSAARGTRAGDSTNVGDDGGLGSYRLQLAVYPRPATE